MGRLTAYLRSLAEILMEGDVKSQQGYVLHLALIYPDKTRLPRVGDQIGTISYTDDMGKTMMKPTYINLLIPSLESLRAILFYSNIEVIYPQRWSGRLADIIEESRIKSKQSVIIRKDAPEDKENKGGEKSARKRARDARGKESDFDRQAYGNVP